MATAVISGRRLSMGDVVDKLNRLEETRDMDVTELIDRYCEVWTEANADRRSKLLASVWHPNATYSDPTVHAANAAELVAHIAKVQAGRPGAKIVRTSAVDVHHNVARFAWQMVKADGSAMPQGLDIAFLAPGATKITRIIGFFGPLA